ncbi:MAG: pyridoxine 5'-phosphate synthase [Candidatus Omnitrophica bacterium]|nr:pyridoxine 5'-phosphate synthase [Candidatus Omnitrophota bacterium]
MPKLGVNIDHIATIRQARREQQPDPVVAAGICELAGADSITAHLREDRRHIQERDVRLLRQILSTKLNLEMAVSPDILRFAVLIKPKDVCLVPEKRKELTTEGGIDVSRQKSKLYSAVKRLKKAGIRTSLFIDPDELQVRTAVDVGADVVELHTGSYARVFFDIKRRNKELERLKIAAGLAQQLGLQVNAGHGLDYHNVSAIASIPGIEELNIGFSIIARAVFVGLDRAVREMKDLVG